MNNTCSVCGESGGHLSGECPGLSVTGGAKKGGNLVFATGSGMSGDGMPSEVLAGSFMFKFADGKECMRFDPNGDVFVRGTKVDTDRKVYESFREWLSHATHMMRKVTG